MRPLALILGLATLAANAAAQPAGLVVTPDTLRHDIDAFDGDPFVLRNAGPESLRLDSLNIGPNALGYILVLGFSYNGAHYNGYAEPSRTFWNTADGRFPAVVLSPGDSATLGIGQLIPTFTADEAEAGKAPDAIVSVRFWVETSLDPLVRHYAFNYYVAAEPPPPGGASALALTGPNPFRSETALTLRLATPAEVDAALYDALGRRVATLAAGAFATGAHPLDVRAGGLSPGLYSVRVAYRTPRGATVLARRLLLLR